MSRALVAALLLSAIPSRTEAAPCCGTGFGLGGRLAVAERGAITLTERGATTVGSFDDAGRFVSSPTADHDRESRTELSVLGRVGTRVQLGATVPLVYTQRLAGGLRGGGGGVGDVAVHGRYDFVPVGGAGGWPGLAATLSVGAPTGRAAREARDPLGADATGLGAFEVRPGIALEKAWWRGFFVAFSSGLAVRTPFEGARGAVRLGPRWSTVLAGGPSFAFGLSLAVGVQHDREVAPNDAGVTGLARRRTSLLAIASYEFDLHWSIVAAGAVDPPLGGLGRNEPVFATATIGLRWVRSAYD